MKPSQPVPVWEKPCDLSTKEKEEHSCSYIPAKEKDEEKLKGVAKKLDEAVKKIDEAFGKGVAKEYAKLIPQNKVCQLVLNGKAQTAIDMIIAGKAGNQCQSNIIACHSLINRGAGAVLRDEFTSLGESCFNYANIFDNAKNAAKPGGESSIITPKVGAPALTVPLWND